MLHIFKELVMRCLYHSFTPKYMFNEGFGGEKTKRVFSENSENAYI